MHFVGLYYAKKKKNFFARNLEWISLAQYRNQRRKLVNTVINCGVLYDGQSAQPNACSFSQRAMTDRVGYAHRQQMTSTLNTRGRILLADRHPHTHTHTHTHTH